MEVLILNESDFDTYCNWIDAKHVQYNGKRYKVIEYRAGNIKLQEI